MYWSSLLVYYAPWLKAKAFSLPRPIGRITRATQVFVFSLFGGKMDGNSMEMEATLRELPKGEVIEIATRMMALTPARHEQSL
jgi:hypothetical protein